MNKHQHSLPLTNVKGRNTSGLKLIVLNRKIVTGGRGAMVFNVQTENTKNTKPPYIFIVLYAKYELNLAFSINGKRYKHLQDGRIARVTFAVET